MPALKNMRQEKFIREYLKTDFNGAEAYRRVYPRHRPDIACVSACQLLRRPKVRERLQEVQEAIIKRSDITVDKILTEYGPRPSCCRHRKRPGRRNSRDIRSRTRRGPPSRSWPSQDATARPRVMLIGRTSVSAAYTG